MPEMTAGITLKYVYLLSFAMQNYELGGQGTILLLVGRVLGRVCLRQVKSCPEMGQVNMVQCTRHAPKWEQELP